MKDEIWKKWFDTRPILFVLANSRSLRAEAQKSGDKMNDPRRSKINLTSDYWKQDNFEIVIMDGGIQINPPPTLTVK